MDSQRITSSVITIDAYCQSLALGAIALKEDLQQDPQWCERTRMRLQDLWGGRILPNEFLDQFVQTVTLASLLAKINTQSEVSEQALKRFLPPNIPILSEIMRALFQRIEVKEKLFGMINNYSLPLPDDQSGSSPSVYLYEHFLKAFSAKSRRDRGTFFTPPEIVQFIVRGVQHIVQLDLGLTGLCDPRSHLIDFATGTGAFLLGAIQQATKERFPESNQDAIIHDKILPRFIGFEPYLVPNIIAQLNVVNLLQSNPHNYAFSPEEHTCIYPLDTLEDPRTNEISAGNPLQQDSIPIIIGNPPYNSDSKNNGRWIIDLLAPYKEGLGEKNLKPLNDDYVKFLRYAQWRVEQAGRGVIGIITNNSFLDGLVHRVMRACIVGTFDRLYLINLHGHQQEDGDESVFDIQKVGVVIILAAKFLVPTEKKEVFYYSLVDHGNRTRTEKLKFLSTHRLEEIPWTSLEVKAPYYWFVPRSSQAEEDYQAGWGLDEIFEIFTSGIETGNDLFYLSFPTENKSLIARVQDVLTSKDEIASKKKYKWLDTTNRTYQKLRTHGKLDQIPRAIRPLHYRPLDIRSCYYERGALSRDRFEVMQHLIGNETTNLAIISVRQVGGQDPFSHVLVSDTIVDNRIMKSTKGKAYVFPQFLFRGSKRITNFQASFLQEMAALYGVTPDDTKLFAYIYAILNSPHYRTRFATQLRKNFPRISFVKDLNLFDSIAEQGRILVETHLLRTPCTLPAGIRFSGNEDSVINKRYIHYNPTQQRLFINDTHYWEGITAEIWNIQIGGWTVLSHWLSERDGKSIGNVGQRNFANILQTLILTRDCNIIVDNLLSGYFS